MTSNNKPFLSADPKSDRNSHDKNLGIDKNTWQQWRKFGLLLLAYFVIWSIAPAFLASSVPFDVSEGVSWGSEWQWGYYKHPPLSSWILYSFYQMFGHIGPYLLSQLYVLLTLFVIYKLGKQVWSVPIALLGSALTLAVVYYGYPSLEFNHNVAQFPIWAGLYLVFYQALTKNRLMDWVLLGVLGGLGMLTKYSVIFLLLPMALYLVLPKQWPLLKQPQPWLAAFIMLALFSPHLYWLMTHDWLPFGYASGRANEVTQGADTIKNHFGWIGFITAQIVAHVPLLLMLIFNRKRLFAVRDYKDHLPAGASLLWYLWLSPIVVLVVLSVVFGMGLRDMWGMPMWALSGLLAASFIIPTTQALMTRKLHKALAIWLSLVTVLMVVYVGFGDKLRDKSSRMQWPEQALAGQASTTWQSVSSCPLDSVSGDRWLGALVAINNGFPSQMISGPASHSPWMSIKRLQQNGTLVMWQSDDEVVLPLLDQLDASASNNSKSDSLIKKQGQWQLAWRETNITEPLVVNWIAYVPARCAK
ncbi:glycosyltransferase family 39 protein [Psychrobacter sp. M13]|uniref:glycosyltransferase family 39 protein n=1 Tax=Psychrobacter sp. M13 TaxID=3067275 RepID=UPI00273C7699|nr:glycosyltransferase family 39 protein [Psychrobacter sp. M13]WLP95681.1 glycosyltransferase family 39 protein [Psychrobacter sp. M13]